MLIKVNIHVNVLKFYLVLMLNGDEMLKIHDPVSNF